MTSAVGILAGHNYQADFISKICQFFFFLIYITFFKILIYFNIKNLLFFYYT